MRWPTSWTGWGRCQAAATPSSAPQVLEIRTAERGYADRRQEYVDGVRILGIRFGPAVEGATRQA